jgi:hypothetical protein
LGDTRRDVELVITTTLKWCEYNKMTLNLRKSVILYITCKPFSKIYNSNLPSAIKGINLQDKGKYLGITIDTKINFAYQMDEWIKKFDNKIRGINRLFYY